ncbi:hypothetical protein Leryth_002678 [Lithospermum erythrorhizon]|nr:hypothetical protein Leryth_002678 [Lithospermum erythrorhizon]
MLGVFSIRPAAAGELVKVLKLDSSPKTTADALMKRFLKNDASAVSLQVGDHVQLAYNHLNQSASHPRDGVRVILSTIKMNLL